MSAPVLIVVDMQRGFDDVRWGARNNPGAEHRIAEVLAAWRRLRWTIMHVRHREPDCTSPFFADSSGYEFKPEALPQTGEAVITKEVNSAFIGTDLEARLRQHGATQLVIGGLTTDHCCSTTARMAANLGFEVVLLADAMATFPRRDPFGDGFIAADIIHHHSLASLHDEFGQVRNVADVIDTASAR